MDNNIKDLLKVNLEIEGLLRILGERPSDEALERLDILAGEFQAKIAALLDSHRPTIVKEDEAVEAEEIPEDVLADEAIEKETASTEDEASEAVAEAVAAAEPKPDPATTAAAPPKPELMKAFSLNDRFRFSRELFGGSMERFSEVLTRLAAIPSMDECERYLESQGIDPGSEIGKEFTGRLSVIFSAKK